jgi:hypothetical protein
MLIKSFTSFTACVAVVSTQGSLASIAPAAETVSNATPAKIPLFDSETIQLTDNVITELQNSSHSKEFASLFEFEDSSNSTIGARASRVRKALRCKTMPGDALYPNETAWSVFDELLGGALEKIVPIGSPCYKNSKYNNYDAEQCAALVRDYNKEEI